MSNEQLRLRRDHHRSISNRFRNLIIGVPGSPMNTDDFDQLRVPIL